MELERVGSRYRNALDELVSLEDARISPLLKSSDIGNGPIRYGRKYLLVALRHPGEDTAPIRDTAPEAWRYLEAHADPLRRRASSVYRNRPPYSIFGVGDYSSGEWKVAISGFVGRVSFAIVEPLESKAVVLDDSTYFLACRSGAEAWPVCRLLDSAPARQFLESMIFWSDKRPITAGILKRLDLDALSRELAGEAEYDSFARRRVAVAGERIDGQVAPATALRAAR